MTFGDANSEIQKLEKQIEFRDYQIKKLNHNYTLLQIEFQQCVEDTETNIQDSKLPNETKLVNQVEDIVNKKKTEEKELENNKELDYEMKNVLENIVDNIQNYNAVKNSPKPDDKSNKSLKIEENNNKKKLAKEHNKHSSKKKIPVIKYDAIEPSAAMLSSLYQEIVRLNQASFCNFFFL